MERDLNWGKIPNGGFMIFNSIKITIAIFMAAVLMLPGLGFGGEKEWHAVRIANDSDRVEDCEFLGEVKGKSSWGGVVENAAESKALNNIKKNAWKMGANFVLMTTGKSGWGGSKYRGEAYLCEPDEDAARAEMTVLGGVEVCGPEKPAVDFLGAVKSQQGSAGSTITAYDFEVPVRITFGGLEADLGRLVTKDGRVEQVIVGWQGLAKADQDQVWSELRQSFEASKGKSGSGKNADRATWIEAGQRKETTIVSDVDHSAIRIEVICRESADASGRRTVETAF